MGYPSKKDLVVELKRRGFKKTAPPKGNDAQEWWTHEDGGVVEIGVMGIRGGCSVGQLRGMCFYVGYQGALRWLRKESDPK